ncbi:MAG TPA: Nif3-like dinuclear metal center hexameric protein [Lentisphaeria bacterium]|nr:MAG: Nif3-like dinuclear metal center hexameric protein [Lentisphaerae bacterium GWF2_49_21]HBC88251.1 Nif3-like dinuclear metal center hexameric protein [Lentisphaeria bacterium]
MAKLKEIVGYLDSLFMTNPNLKDDSNNGLQVQGALEVEKAVFGVDACSALFEKTVAKKADFIFVHHGLSWNDSLKRLIGPNARRVSPLFKNDISLYAAHLPLDMHPEIGHNILIAKMLKLQKCRNFVKYNGGELGIAGELNEETSTAKVSAILDKELDTKCTVLGNAVKPVKKIAIISGGGCRPDSVVEAARQGMDCFIVGEGNHTSFHFIKEENISVIVAGHYATEKPGVIAVMGRIKEKFGIDCEFVDIPTGL